MQTEYPELNKKILLRIHEVSDLIVKNKNILRTSKYQEFIVKKLKGNLTQDQRNALIDNLRQNQQLLILASSGLPFSADIFELPHSSPYPTQPIPRVVLMFSILISFCIGVAICFFIDLFRNRK